MKSGKCPLCDDPSKGMAMVGDLAVTRAYLQKSASFRGYCILVLKHHAVELDDLPADERCALMEDIARVAHAVRAVCKPRKINYEILGNVVPHVHVHIIPRYETDPTWDRAAWFALPDEVLLLDDEYSALAEELRAVMAYKLGAGMKLEEISADLRDEAKRRSFGRDELESAIKSVRTEHKPDGD